MRKYTADRITDDMLSITDKSLTKSKFIVVLKTIGIPDPKDILLKIKFLYERRKSKTFSGRIIDNE